MDLPFGLKGTDDVLASLKDVEAAIAQRPDLRERLAIRTAAKDQIKADLVSSGVLSQRQARNPNYFRHQVLEYAEMRARGGGGGKKVQSTYWHARRGSEKDINANYFQAESDWMYKAHQDIATARFLNWLRTSQYNMKRDLVRRAKAENTKAMNAMTRKDRALSDRWSKSGRNIAVAMSALRQDLMRRKYDALATADS